MGRAYQTTKNDCRWHCRCCGDALFVDFEPRKVRFRFGGQQCYDDGVHGAGAVDVGVISIFTSTSGSPNCAGAVGMSAWIPHLAYISSQDGP